MCRDCKKKKALREYYVHKQMGDGHLNKCKDCVKDRIRRYWDDGRGKEVDKKRQQKPARKEWQRLYSAKMRKKHYKKSQCRIRFWNEYAKGMIEKLPCSQCGTTKLVEAHHPDYDKPFKIKWLCSYHHKEWHRNNKALNDQFK